MLAQALCARPRPLHQLERRPPQFPFSGRAPQLPFSGPLPPGVACSRQSSLAPADDPPALQVASSARGRGPGTASGPSDFHLRGQRQERKQVFASTGPEARGPEFCVSVEVRDTDCFCPPARWHKQHHRHPRHSARHPPRRISWFIPALPLLPVLGERLGLNGVAVVVVFVL